MFGVGVVEMLLICVVGLVAPLLAAYWVVRLAVRHGIDDARTRRPADPVDRGL